MRWLWLGLAVLGAACSGDGAGSELPAEFVDGQLYGGPEADHAVTSGVALCDDGGSADLIFSGDGPDLEVVVDGGRYVLIQSALGESRADVSSWVGFGAGYVEGWVEGPGLDDGPRVDVTFLLHCGEG